MDELLEYGIYLALLVALAIPLSGYINKVMAGERVAVLSRVLVPVENVVYRCIRVDRADVMGWKRYLISALVFSALSLAGLFAILMLQGVLPGNPEGLPGLTWDLAFNTAASFVTNTNWQAYSGESALSYFSQAIGLTVQNFVTPAVGMAVLFALFRGLVSEGGPGLGNFFVDATRAVLFVLIPLALVVTVVDVWQGSPQNVSEDQEVQLLEPVGIDSEGEVVEADDPAAVQVIDEGVVPMGPQASQVAIKQLGTNGGGYNGVNSASALENPTPHEPGAVHLAFAHPVRARVQLRPFRGRSAAGAGYLRGHVHSAGGKLGGDSLLRAGWNASACGRRLGVHGHVRPVRRQHGGQGGTFRRDRFLPLGRIHHSRIERLGQLHA